MLSYKSYCWSLGTTSFRMVEFNRKIEKQLELLQEFWANPEFFDQLWSNNNDLQSAYYKFMTDKEFIVGDAPRKDKDAREKTSGLVDLGLITNERKITEAGQALLNIAISGNFDDNNILQIAADSYIYFKQLLKVSSCFEDGIVRPFVVLAYFISQLGYLTKDEFTYLLPLATSQLSMQKILSDIREMRNGRKTIDEVILSKLLAMDNYQEALATLLANNVDENLIIDIGMNRKSRTYDISYYPLYVALYNFWQNKTDENVVPLLNAIKAINGKCKTLWKQLIFNTSSSRTILRDRISTINTNTTLFNCANEVEFKTEFFNKLHLLKAKSLLSDYYDLNKRYFKTTDTVLFQDNTIKFDIVPHCLFDIVKDSLLDIAFTNSKYLYSNVGLTDISNIFDITNEQIFEKIEAIYGVQARNLVDVQAFVNQERYNRFNQMIDNKFTDENLIELMTMFENRNDENIQNMVTNNADIPTIFEYVLAIAWYKISGRKGNVLEYMNLSLDADLLPVTHAAGGHEDITYKYLETADYPAHTLLIEATLANGTNQRRMEMEPVSRHLGDYILSHNNEEAYCVFATTFLHVNVIADFRGRKVIPYYSTDGTRCVESMKIIPCATAEIKTIIAKHITYAQLYRIFEEAHQSDTAPNMWYQQEIVTKTI